MEHDPNINSRLLQFIQHIGMGIGSFAYNCGVSQANILSGKLTRNAIGKILSAYPELNPLWLKNGEGEMLGKPVIIKAVPPEIITQKIEPERPSKPKLSTNVLPSPTQTPKPQLQRKPHRGKKTRPIRDRLRLFIASLNLSSSEFAKTIGVLESRVSKIDDTPNDLLTIIYRKYPKLNPQWLEYGNGEMLRYGSGINTIGGGRKRAEEWKTESIGYKWVLEKVLEGVPRKEIIQEFNKRHEQDPQNYSTRTGKPLSDGILSIWIKNSGITPPVIEKPHPYKNTNSEAEENVLPKITVQDILSSIIAHKNKQLSTTDLPLYKPVDDNNLQIYVTPKIERKSNKKRKTPNTNGIKAIFIAIGAITGLALIIFIIAEYAFPAIFIGLLFLSMIFAKK